MAQAGSFGFIQSRLGDVWHRAGDGLAVLGLPVGEPAIRRPDLVVEIHQNGLVFLAPNGMTGARVIGRSRDAGFQFATDLQSALATLPEGARAVGLAVSPELALDLALELPMAPLPDLNRAVAAFAAQETPFADGEGLVAWTISRADWQTATAKIALFPARLVMPVLDALQEAGVKPACVLHQAGDFDSAVVPPWLAGAQTPSGQSWRDVFNAQSSFVRAAVAGLALVSLSWGASQVVMNLELWRAADATEIARGVDKQLAKSDVDAWFLSGRQKAALARVRVLDQMAERLTNTTWFERLDVKEGKIEVVGYAPSAAEALRTIAAIPGVKAAELTASVTRDQTLNIERFRLSAELGETGKP